MSHGTILSAINRSQALSSFHSSLATTAPRTAKTTMLATSTTRLYPSTRPTARPISQSSTFTHSTLSAWLSSPTSILLTQKCMPTQTIDHSSWQGALSLPQDSTHPTQLPTSGLIGLHSDILSHASWIWICLEFLTQGLMFVVLMEKKSMRNYVWDGFN